MNRRKFIGAAVSVGIARVLKAQPLPGSESEWGAPVIDCHFHARPTHEADLKHLSGSGCQAAYLLCDLRIADDAKRFMSQEPTRIAGYSVSTNVSSPDAVQLLTDAVKAGAHGFGELKYHVQADGPEMRRLYSAAAELGVPLTIHFQELGHSPTEGVFNTGFKRFDKILAAYPQTTFVGHCDAFWANVSADYQDDEAYPRKPIVRGGITDRWLSDYPNLFGGVMRSIKSSRGSSFLLRIAAAGVCIRGLAQVGAAQQASGDSGVTTLHAYADLVQLPTLVLDTDLRPFPKVE